jgi:hypothetical protein
MTDSSYDEGKAVELRRRPLIAAIVFYLLFIAGTVIFSWFAWSQRSAQENPAIIPLIAWIVSGITHSWVHNLGRACKLSASGCALVYTMLVAFTNTWNEMFGVGLFIMALAGYAFAWVMGVPVSTYRKSFDGQGGHCADDRRREDGKRDMALPYDLELRRFWFPTPGAFGIGVTAYSRSDAESLAREAAERLGRSFETGSVIEDVDVRDLDRNHVVPNMGPAEFRGVWFPRLNI